MDSTQLSPRLQAVANFVPVGARLADIGSDHAYLPVNLLMNDHIKYAIIGEVSQGPLDNARHELQKRRVSNRAEGRLADGLLAVNDEDEIDTVTIAGMGGILISDILEASSQRHQSFNTLILQPNTDEAIVRRWLMAHHYQIIGENIVQEDTHFYEIIVAVPGEQVLSELDVEFGPFLRIEKTATFVAKWQKEIDRITVILDHLKVADKAQTEAYYQWQARYHQILEVMS